MMQRFRSTVDPTRDPVAGKVVAAFDAAKEAGLSTCDCYRASVDVWRRAYPDQRPQYASKQAVDVILKARLAWGFETDLRTSGRKAEPLREFGVSKLPVNARARSAEWT
jgi:hypothetical protein